jgi:hypothetical protein
MVIHLTPTSVPKRCNGDPHIPAEPVRLLKTKGMWGKKQPEHDIYQRATDTLIQALEKGVRPWICPWKVTSPC